MNNILAAMLSSGRYPVADGQALSRRGPCKRRQQADIKRAKALHAEYKDRKAAARVVGKPTRPKR